MVHASLRVNKPGPFLHSLTLFLDDGQLREVTITVQGQAIEAKSLAKTEETVR